jgi:L-fucose isomerase-like protein
LWKGKVLQNYSNWNKTPQKAFETITRLGVVLDALVDEMKLDAMAVRCWIEMQKQYGISCCVLLSEMNNRKVPVACEVDVGSAVSMHALRTASGNVASCLDWNNNYGDDDNKCILFHCGPVPQAMMAATGVITDHAILANSVGQGCSYGCNTGRIKPSPFTFGNLITEGGKLKFYLGEGNFTADPIPANFFGCAGVAEFADMQHTLQTIGLAGHRHHTAVTPGHVMAPVKDAFENATLAMK